MARAVTGGGHGWVFAKKKGSVIMWMKQYRVATAGVITEPFWRCLADAIAAVETDCGRRVIQAEGGINEIGYKALAGWPWVRAKTRETNGLGGLESTEEDFRVFLDREQQARALLYLLRSSTFYEAARLLYVLAFYSAYAPGRADGARELVQVFNQIAGLGVHVGVRPFTMIHGGEMEDGAVAINHEAARQAVRLFAELAG